MRRANDSKVAVGRAEITSRQLDVLRLVASGLGNKEIAARIGKTESDVKGVVSRLLLKLHAANRAELAQIAARLDLLGESDLAKHEIRELLQLSPVLTAMLRGPDHRFVFANAAYERSTQERELVGRTVAEVFPHTPEFVKLCDQVYNDGTTIRSRGPVVIVGDLGVWRELDLAFVLRPVREDTGRITGIFFVGLDLAGVLPAGPAAPGAYTGS